MIRALQKEPEKVQIYSTTPEIGWGNRVERLAINKILKDAGFEIIGENPAGFWIDIARRVHTSSSQNVDEAIEYTKNSAQLRDSIKTKPFISSLERFIKNALKNNPGTHFFLTPQNMMGEAATRVSINGRKFTVIMVLPDAMGKLSPYRKPTEAQRNINYLVWNRNAYEIMKSEHGLEYVQLIYPVDPQKGFQELSTHKLKELGFTEIFEQENVCVIKLSGGGGDAHFISAIIESLWNNSKVRSIVFPGQQVTQNKIIDKVKGNSRKIVKSLDEEAYYNVTAHMQPDSQMVLLQPSEQVKYMFVRSMHGQRLRVAWLPPKGDQEKISLINYILIASKQGIISTICLPQKHHDYLHGELKHAGFIQGIDYQLIEPENIKKEHFTLAPSWEADESRYTEPRLSVDQAIRNILAGRG